jgi:hypothetical protein
MRNGGGDGAGLSPGARADELELEVEAIRGNLGELVSELDQRRHHLFDVRRQARQHPLVFALACLGLGGLVFSTLALAVHARRRRRSPLVRAVGFRRAMRRAAAHPDRVARDTPRLGKKILAAGGAAAASEIARRLARKLLVKQAAR